MMITILAIAMTLSMLIATLVTLHNESVRIDRQSDQD